MKFSTLLFLLSLTIFSTIFMSCNSASSTFNSEDFETIYVGTYTQKEDHVHGKADGIFVLKMNKKTGELHVANTIIGITNPSYLAIHPNKKYLYAVQEASINGNYGRILAFNIESDLEGMNEGMNAEKINSVHSNGHAPCHISIDPTGKYLLVANYMEKIASYPIHEDGSIGGTLSVFKHERTLPEAFRQETGHPHMILPALDSHSIFVSDLGLDSIFHYELSDSGWLHLRTKTATQPQSGPRHMDFHPNNQWCYVLNELNRTVEVFKINNPNEPFERVQTIATLAKEDENVNPAAIHLHPSGKFLYASNRGLNGSETQSISVFGVNAETGELTLIDETNTKGEIPRDFTISPDGQFLLVAHQNTDNVVTFKINAATGKLEDTGHELKISTPVCLKFL